MINWNEWKGKLKQRLAKLTNNDLLSAEGEQNESLGKLEIRLDKTREALRKLTSENNK